MYEDEDLQADDEYGNDEETNKVLGRISEENKALQAAAAAKKAKKIGSIGSIGGGILGLVLSGGNPAGFSIGSKLGGGLAESAAAGDPSALVEGVTGAAGSLTAAGKKKKKKAADTETESTGTDVSDLLGSLPDIAKIAGSSGMA